ncbi:MAG: hypothetical protein LUG65_04380 [Clostridiales bacterium]|nr:hypothetical protein [Clostridiales bacterium]
MTGTTKSGFSFSVDEVAAAADNMELLDALAEMESDNDPLAVSRVCRLLLGRDTRKALYDHLRTEDGRVPVAQVVAELLEIMGSTSAGKN